MHVAAQHICISLPCADVVPGVLMSSSSLESAQALAQNENPALGDNPVSLCPYGTYFPGGVLNVTDPSASTCISW
jgi:hypothetical protein